MTDPVEFPPRPRTPFSQSSEDYEKWLHAKCDAMTRILIGPRDESAGKTGAMIQQLSEALPAFGSTFIDPQGDAARDLFQRLHDGRDGTTK